MKKCDFFKKDGLRPSEEQLLQTKVFYQHSSEIYAHFDKWKDIDRFYFIPLSGRVDLEYECSCGQKGFETVSGWRLRANALRDQIAADTPRFRKYKRRK